MLSHYLFNLLKHYTRAQGAWNVLGLRALAQHLASNQAMTEAEGLATASDAGSEA